jgi:hypothetical protein
VLLGEANATKGKPQHTAALIINIAKLSLISFTLFPVIITKASFFLLTNMD